MQSWDGPGLEANGTKVEYASALSESLGVRLPYVGAVFSEDHPEREVSFSVELCERVDHAMHWHCEGTYINLYGCHGKLSFSGFHQDSDNSGHYAITGGTEDFLGAKGYIVESPGKDGNYVRHITISF